MSLVLAELGRQLAGRWAALLLLPGAFFVSVVVVAAILGHSHALDTAPLSAWLDSVAATPASGRLGTVLIAAGGFTAASAAAGLAASTAARMVEQLWSASGEEPLLHRLAARRKQRWERADEEVSAMLLQFTESGGAPQVALKLRRAIILRDAMCPVPAGRPTWVGDRLYAVDQRVHDSYHIDLSAAWPRLWLMLPDAARAELASAQNALASAARVAGWGLLYLPVAALWWPAAVLTAGTLLTARHRARSAAAIQADLVEAAVDLYGRDMVLQLGLDCPGQLTRETGDAANTILRKDLTGRSRFDEPTSQATDQPDEGAGGHAPLRPQRSSG